MSTVQISRHQAWMTNIFAKVNFEDVYKTCDVVEAFVAFAGS